MGPEPDHPLTISAKAPAHNAAPAGGERRVRRDGGGVGCISLLFDLLLNNECAYIYTVNVLQARAAARNSGGPFLFPQRCFYAHIPAARLFYRALWKCTTRASGYVDSGS